MISSQIFETSIEQFVDVSYTYIAYNCKYKLDDIIQYNTYFNPINVDISKDLIRLNKLYRNNRKRNGLKDKKIGKEID